MPHRGLLGLVRWHRRVYGVTPDDRAPQMAGEGFDASVWELWPYLASGAAVVFPPEGARADPAALVPWLAEAGITLAFLPTPVAERRWTSPGRSTIACGRSWSEATACAAGPTPVTASGW